MNEVLAALAKGESVKCRRKLCSGGQASRRCILSGPRSQGAKLPRGLSRIIPCPLKIMRERSQYHRGADGPIRRTLTPRLRRLKPPAVS